MSRGPSVPGSIGRDVADAGPRVQRVVRPAAQATARSPVKSDDGVATRIAAVEKCHGPTLARHDRSEPCLHAGIMPVTAHSADRPLIATNRTLRMRPHRMGNIHRRRAPADKRRQRPARRPVASRDLPLGPPDQRLRPAGQPGDAFRLRDDGSDRARAPPGCGSRGGRRRGRAAEYPGCFSWTAGPVRSMTARVNWHRVSMQQGDPGWDVRHEEPLLRTTAGSSCRTPSRPPPETWNR